jgi:predicted secreted acid phosphatase
MNKFIEWKYQMQHLICNIKNKLEEIRNINNKLSVIFDIDDTLIDVKGNCIGEIVYIYNYVKKLGIDPIIITNRAGTKDIMDYTMKQLSNCNITEYRYLYFRDPTKTNDPYKYKEDARKDVFNKGYFTVISIGDQMWDIGNYGGLGFIVPTI